MKSKFKPNLPVDFNPYDSMKELVNKCDIGVQEDLCGAVKKIWLEKLKACEKDIADLTVQIDSIEILISHTSSLVLIYCN